MANETNLTADDLRDLVALLKVEVAPTYDHEIDCLARGLAESRGPGALLPARLLLALLEAKLRVLELEQPIEARTLVLDRWADTLNMVRDAAKDVSTMQIATREAIDDAHAAGVLEGERKAARTAEHWLEELQDNDPDDEEVQR